MGILDVLRVPVHACVSGEISGPALGVLASCPHRSGYPNAIFVLAEPGCISAARWPRSPPASSR